MEVYVKSFATWRTIKQARSLSHDLVLDSLDKETSTVTVAGTKINRNDAGNWLVADGKLYLIQQVKPQDNRTVLTLLPPLDAFARSILFEEQANGQTVGKFIAAMLTAHWTNGSDPAYAIPYLVVSSSDPTAFVAPEVDNTGLFDLAAYCRLMRKTYRITVSFRITLDQLICTVGVVAADSRQVPFSDGLSQLKSVDYAATAVAKITAYQGGVASDWYLSEDGTVSQTVPSQRAVGAWTSISVSEKADLATKVAETFAKNRSGHKVEFMSSRDLDVMDDCTFLIHGEPLASYISCKRKMSTDNRFYYKAGELATTASEKLKGVTK